VSASRTGTRSTGARSTEAPGTRAPGTPGTRPTGTPGTRSTEAPGTRSAGTPGTPSGTPGTRSTEARGTRSAGTPGTPSADGSGTPSPGTPGTPSADGSGTPSPGTSTSPVVPPTGSAYAQALQAALAGEHAAVWACGRAAAELSAPQRRRALAQLDEHRQSRDQLAARLTALGIVPVQAAPAYQLPFPVADDRGARRLLARIGASLAATYADLAAASPQAARRDVVRASTRAAVQALGWGAPPQAFPGT